MKRSSAEKFAWANETTGHEATIFEIMWKNTGNYYLMDMSAFPEEKEVLLQDGSKFEVIAVDTIKDQNNKTLNIIVLKCEGYKDWRFLIINFKNLNDQSFTLHRNSKIFLFQKYSKID